MAPVNAAAPGLDSRASTPKLETPSQENPPPDTSLEPRLDLMEKTMEYLKKAVQQILRNQIYGPSRKGREATTLGFLSPSSSVQFPTSALPRTALERHNHDGILPSLVTEIQMRTVEPRHSQPPFEMMVAPPPPPIDSTTKHVDLPMKEETQRIGCFESKNVLS